jgi:hypothetical protein
VFREGNNLKLKRKIARPKIDTRHQSSLARHYKMKSYRGKMFSQGKTTYYKKTARINNAAQVTSDYKSSLSTSSITD